MPRQWLSLPEVEQLAVERTGGQAEAIRAMVIEGGQAGEIVGRNRGPRGQVKAMTASQWYWPINWERSELSVQAPVNPPSELDLLIRERTPAKDLPAVLEAELLIEQMRHGGVRVAHWFWARIEVERETLLSYVEPDPLLRPGSTAADQDDLGQPRRKEPETLVGWYKEYVRGLYSSREQDLKAARDKFGRWTKDRERMRELRDEHAPLSWRKSGPRSGVD